MPLFDSCSHAHFRVGLYEMFQVIVGCSLATPYEKDFSLQWYNSSVLNQVFCQKDVDIIFREINLSSQYQLPKSCGMYKMHHGEVYSSSVYHCLLVSFRDLIGAFGTFQ